MRFILSTILLLGLNALTSVSFANEVSADSTSIRQLKLNSALKDSLNLRPEFQIESGIQRSDLFKKYAPAAYLELIAPHKEQNELSLYQVRLLFRPLHQRLSSSDLTKEKALVDSLYDCIYTVVDTEKWFKDQVRIYSTQKDIVWLNSYQETEDFHHIVRNLKVGEISHPFTTAKGVYLVQLLAKKTESSVRQQESVDLSELLRLYGVYTSLNRSNDLPIIKTPFQSYFYKDFVEFSKNHTQGEAFAWVAYQKYILGKTIQEVLSEGKEYALLSTNISTDILLKLAFNKFLQDNKIDFEKELEAYISVNEEAYLKDYTSFNGMLIYSKKKKEIKRLNKILKELPTTKWIVFIDSYNREKKKEVFSYFSGNVRVSDNKLVKDYFAKAASSSPRKLKKLNQRYILHGTIDKTAIDTKNVREVMKKDFLKYLDNLWVESLRR